MSIPHATYVPHASPTYSFLSQNRKKKKSHADNVTFLAHPNGFEPPTVRIGI